MPPRATIEEEFDDDTDLALPSKALPNTGTRGALLEEITSDDDGDGDGDDDDMIIPMHPTVQPRAPPSFASASSTSRFSAAGPPTGSNVTTDKSLFKK
jgi:signal recognition particle subunit SRP19